jgi:hypothetical protein
MDFCGKENMGRGFQGEERIKTTQSRVNLRGIAEIQLT